MTLIPRTKGQSSLIGSPTFYPMKIEFRIRSAQPLVQSLLDEWAKASTSQNYLIFTEGISTLFQGF